MFLHMTNFTAQQFNLLWEASADFIRDNWNTGRGRKTSAANKDILFMTLTSEKHGGTWEWLASKFAMKGPTFERLVLRFLGLMADEIYRVYVEKNYDTYPMMALMERGVPLDTLHSHGTPPMLSFSRATALLGRSRKESITIPGSTNCIV